MTPTNLREDASIAAAHPAGRDVQAAVRFIVPQDSKPYFHSAALTGGLPRIFFETEARTVTIRDMRPIADALSLDRQGFVLRRHRTAVADLYDDEAVERVYYPEIEALLRETTGAARVVIFDCTRRWEGPSGTTRREGLREPASRVHVDYTVGSGPKRAGDFLGAGEVQRILGAGGRLVQVNVWRPITGPVQRAPLAVAGADSVRMDELIATDQVFPERVGEIYQLAHHPGQRWYWAPAMERDEVLLLKSWDSLDDGRARFTPHGAFEPPDQRPDAPARESIELRTYLVFDA